MVLVFHKPEAKLEETHLCLDWVGKYKEVVDDWPLTQPRSGFARAIVDRYYCISYRFFFILKLLTVRPNSVP